MKRSLFHSDGKEQVVYSQVVGDLLWVHIDGQTIATPLKEKPKRRGSSGAGEGEEGEVFAPMPGKVTQLNAKKGENVSKGQILVVMEAMKMEYNLKASTDGVIETIGCKAGDQVGLGQLLVKIQTQVKT